MATPLMMHNGPVQGQRYPLDSGRRELQATIMSLLNQLGAEFDLVKRAHSLLSKYPDLASLKSRIKYPEEIAKVNVRDLTSLTTDLEDASRKAHEIGTELLQLATYYRDFEQKYRDGTPEIRAALLSTRVQVEGDLIEPHLITQKVALRLLSRNRFGDIIQQNADGNHPVVAVGGVHFKGASDIEPLDTGMEIAVYLLHSLLFGEEIGQGLAPSSLLTLANVEVDELSTPLAGKERDRFEEASGSNQREAFFNRHPNLLVKRSHTFPLQASKTIEGKRLDEVIDEQIDWDEENFSSLVLASFLTIPSDNKPDNFMVVFNKIIGIDNDMVFAYPLMAYGKKKQHTVGFKNALLCFGNMMDKPVAPKVRERIAKLDPILLGIEWGVAVLQQEQSYPIQDNKQVRFPLRFTKHTLHQLIENLQILQKAMGDSNLSSMTHRDLFRLFFPVVERYYQGLVEGTKSISERIENLFLSKKLLPAEEYLKEAIRKKEKLVDGRTINDALDSYDKRMFSHEEDRGSSIEELCCEVLRTTDLSLLTPQRQYALFSLAARYFPQIVDQKPHLSWRGEMLPFVLFREHIDLAVLPFLQGLGVNLSRQNSDGDTLVHVLVKQGQTLVKEFLQAIKVSFEVKNRRGLTPLDIALEQRQVDSVIVLIEAGAGTCTSSSRAWEFYKDCVKGKENAGLVEVFEMLIKRSQGVAWKIAKETIFLPKGDGGVIAVGALHGERKLHPAAVEQLWQDNKFQAVNTTGKRLVGKVTIDGFTLYFKQMPELPGVEQAVETLMHQVMEFGAPHTDLYNINGTPYLVSQGISGLTLQQVLDTHPSLLGEKLNKRKLSQLIIMTMLIKPEDGKPDNYVVERLPDDSYQIVSIDNDHSFVPSVAKDQDKKTRVQVKTILYCLDQMNDPIEPSVREQFLMHDPAEILNEWLAHLLQVQGLYNSLFTEEQRTHLFDKYGVFVGIPFTEAIVFALYRNMVKMQFILDQAKGKPLSHMDLLAQLDPLLASRYREGFRKPLSPMTRFLAVDGGDYISKNGALISTRHTNEILVSYDIATKTEMKELIRSGGILDVEGALRKLQACVNDDRRVLAEQILSAKEAVVDFSSLSAEQISDALARVDFSTVSAHIQQAVFDQIKRFVWKELIIRNASVITNAYLKKLNFSRLITLRLPGCQGLTDKVVRQVIEQAPQLQVLDLSGIRSSGIIWGFQEVGLVDSFLPTIRLDLNNVTHLILNQCSNLQTLGIEGDKLVVVECEDTHLEVLGIRSPTLTNLSVKNSKWLTDEALDWGIFECDNLRTLNVEGCSKISEQELRTRTGFPLSYLGTLERNWQRSFYSMLHNRKIKCSPDSHLQLSFGGLGNVGARLIARALSINTSLLGLRLPGRQGLDVATTFERTLHAMRGLFEDDNGHIEKPGVIALAQALAINATLWDLDLSGNRMGDEGAIAIARGLVKNKSLRRLDLSYNKIGSEGAKELAAALSINTSLLLLKLSPEKIGDEGMEVIRSCGFAFENGWFTRGDGLDESASSLELLPKNMAGSQSTSFAVVPFDEMEREGMQDPVRTPEGLYLQGQALERRDQNEAIDCYLEAAMKEHGESLHRLKELSETLLQAQYALGCYYEAGHDIPLAASHFAVAAAGTHLQAKQALTRLANTHPEAQSQLAILLESGLGMKQNIAHAITLHRQAADRGVGLSQLHLGALYYMGFSTEEDKKLALSLIGKAEALGVPLAGKLKAQILKENKEVEKMVKKAVDIEHFNYLLAHRKVGADLLKELPPHDQEAFSRTRSHMKRAQGQALERTKTDLQEQKRGLVEQMSSADSIKEELLKKRIEELDRTLGHLGNTERVHADPAAELRQFILNQARLLFYSGFKERISAILQASNAIVSGDASRNVSLMETTLVSGVVQGAGYAAKHAAKAIPFAGVVVDVTSFAIEKYISYQRDEEVKRQCLKVQGYYPEQGIMGANRLASTIASSLVYRFQDHLSHLDGESLVRLINHFTLSFTEYLHEKAPEDATMYELVLGGALYKSNVIKELLMKTTLKTHLGLVWSIDDLLFSTGVQTIYGGKYLPKDPKRRAWLDDVVKNAEEHKKDYPSYRWGTRMEVEMLANLGIEMECQEEERVGVLVTKIDPKKAAARYFQEAESLTQQFLDD